MRVIGTLIVFVLAALPAVFAGWPGLAPSWFDGDFRGIPMSVVAMSGLMAVFIVLAGVCSLIARTGRIAGQEDA